MNIQLENGNDQRLTRKIDVSANFCQKIVNEGQIIHLEKPLLFSIFHKNKFE